MFKQPSQLQCDEPVVGMTTEGRSKWSAQKFVTKYNLGRPVAGNFFQAKYDDYVPKLYEKLSAH